MNPNAVWITGVGAVSGAGNDTRQTLKTFFHGEPKPCPRLPFESTINCPTFQVDAPLPDLPGPRQNSRTLRLAMHAVTEALTEAALPTLNPQTRLGVCLGTTVACQLNNIAFYNAYRRKTQPDMNVILNYLHANLAEAVGSLLLPDSTGPRITVVNACTSGADAIGVAADWIRCGLCDLAIAGGADELHQVPLAGFWSLGVMSTELCRPFDRDRAGLNLGEGAGIVILESSAHAQNRGHRCDFELAGFAAACDAHHLTAPHPEGRGLESAIRSALRQANLTPENIAFINAHGTATLDNDRAESAVLAKLFPKTPFLSTKGYTGHTLGAAGGLEAVFTLLALRERWIPRNAGFENPANDIPRSPNQTRTPIHKNCALSTSLAFGGNNAALVIRRTAP